MTKEQEEALYRLKLHSEYAVLSNDKLAVVNKADIETVLNMLKEKDKEIESKNRLLQIVGIELNEAETKIEEKDKIIDLMTERLRYYNGMQQKQEFCIDICEGKECNIEKCKERIKQYFERKVENEL